MENDILSEIIAVERDIQERLVAEERSAGTMLCSLRQDLEEEARREEERLAAARREAESSARVEAEERAAAIMRQAGSRAEQWSGLDDRTLERCIMEHLVRILPGERR
jgi:vacuolar-type H+-ATPase subunit H